MCIKIIMTYCANCGTRLESIVSEERERAFCPQCRRIQYHQLKVGAGALIEQDNRILLLQRNHEPFQDCWNLPAGYVEYDEDPAQTAIREVFEECGLHIEIEQLVDVYFFTDDPRGNGILIVYKCQVVGGELLETAEGRQPTFFSSETIPDNLSHGGHDQAIRAWKSTQAQKNVHAIQFRKLAEADLPLLHAWLHTEAVKTWYAKGDWTYDQVVQKYTSRIAGASPTSSFLILYHGRPIGYIQTYRICDYPGYNDSVQADETAAGVDLFIGEPAYLHKGLGSQILRKFLGEIVFAFKGIMCCIIGPEPRNRRAIRCYEKAGFRYWKTIHPADEAEPEYLMMLHRTDMNMDDM